MNKKIAVVGAGIYGCTTALKLAARGCSVDLYDEVGVMRCASAINQYRIHRGYHYPRSRETIQEILEAHQEFVEEYEPAIVHKVQSYYAIPKEGSYTDPDKYISVMDDFGLALREEKPGWVDFDFIDRVWNVEERIYDPYILRSLVVEKLEKSAIEYKNSTFLKEMEEGYDHVVYATYGLHGAGAYLFPRARYQVVEKIRIALPEKIRNLSLVVVDGPFTAFDPLGESAYSLFGSAKHTTHWSTDTFPFDVPPEYRELLNGAEFIESPLTHFEQMRAEAAFAVPSAARAEYHGSRYTIRVVEDNPGEDRRVLYVKNSGKNFYIFSGKVVSAVKAARIVCDSVCL
ncbi:MAG: FAD-dependent oxidoreductase [Sulfurimonas sp.]|nr:FAD-dependent oxidoreductase [Sulfurimonas sp.]